MSIIKILSLSVFLITVPLAVCFGDAPPVASTNFDQCVAAGNKVIEGNPRRCLDSGGFVFIEMKEKEASEEKACKDLCGDGRCQEIVCLSIGCPCAETSDSCPKDCPKGE